MMFYEIDLLHVGNLTIKKTNMQNLKRQWSKYRSKVLTTSNLYIQNEENIKDSEYKRKDKERTIGFISKRYSDSLESKKQETQEFDKYWEDMIKNNPIRFKECLSLWKKEFNI